MRFLLHPSPARQTPVARLVLGNNSVHLASAADNDAVPSGIVFYSPLADLNLMPQLRAGIVPKLMAILVPVPVWSKAISSRPRV